MSSKEQFSVQSDRSIKYDFIPESNQELSREITRLAGHINAAQYRFLVLLGALIERDAWGCEGTRSPAHWLNYYCGIDMGAAREKVRVAKVLPNLPKISEAFRTGTISYSKVRAMTRSATPENEQLLLNVAQYGTAQHVELLVRRYRSLKRAHEPDQAKTQYEARELTWHYDDDGMLVIKGRLPPEEGVAFLKAMHAIQEAMFKQKRNDLCRQAGSHRSSIGMCGSRPAGEDQATITEPIPMPEKNVSAETSIVEELKSTYEQKRADVLLAMAEQALNTLDNGLKPQSPADKYQVVLHIERDRLNQKEEAASNHHCTLEHGPWHFPLSAIAAKRLACDASLVTVLEDNAGNVLNVGRKTRSVPPAIRRALILRDQTCRFPGCCESRFVDAHHIRHWCDGGETKLDNLVLLCRHHHRFLHQEGYGIEKRGGEFVFVKPDGRKMEYALARQFQDGEDDHKELKIESRHEELDLKIEPETAITLWGGEALHYDIALAGLMYFDDCNRASPPS